MLFLTSSRSTVVSGLVISLPSSQQVLLGVMAGAFCLAGWYFGSKPTSATSESNIRIGQSSMPWEIEDVEKDVPRKTSFKYQYHPHGDKTKPLKKAPSALNEVVVPNVTLPKVSFLSPLLGSVCLDSLGGHCVSDVGSVLP
jgi:hypothetical protein